MRGDAFKRWLGLPGMAGAPPETGLAAVTRLLQALRQARQMTTSADFHVLSIDSADLAGLQVAPSQAVISQAQREGVSWLCADSRLLRKARDENKENCQPGMHVLLLKDEEICYQGVVAHVGQTSQILSELLWRDPRYSTVLDISQLAPVTPALPYQAYKAADSASRAGLHPSHSLARAHASSNGGTLKSGLRSSTSLPPSRASENGSASLNGHHSNGSSNGHHSSSSMNGSMNGGTPHDTSNGGGRAMKPALRKSVSLLTPTKAHANGLVTGSHEAIFSEAGAGYQVEKSLVASEQATAAQLAATQELVHAYNRQIDELHSKLEQALKDVGALTEELQNKRSRTDEFREQISKVVADYNMAIA